MALAAGSPHQSPAGDALDNTLARLKQRAENFAREPALKKLGWLVQMRERFARSAEQWVRCFAGTCQQMKMT